jgi:hypothetical protein
MLHLGGSLPAYSMLVASEQYKDDPPVLDNRTLPELDDLLIIISKVNATRRMDRSDANQEFERGGYPTHLQ